MNPELPEVVGRRIACSIEAMEFRLRRYIAAEQEKLLPDNALIATLADAVRMGREYSDIMNEPPKAT